ncbi:hypothetical protein VTP01DRAFT_4497 [Rhizomucor pusillus]|uniref:uncharacterized protein n=1 Tax=Rhizomucor pusillus TaxID=4840 RepID=UPI0037443D08
MVMPNLKSSVAMTASWSAHCVNRCFNKERVCVAMSRGGILPFHSQERGDDGADPYSEADEHVMHVPRQIMAALDLPPVPRAAKTVTTQREFDDAILHACGQRDPEDKGKTLWIIDQMRLQIFDGQHCSHSAESYPNSASGAMSSNNDTASRAVHLNLLHAILSGPFHGALLERKYVELNDESLSLAE